MAAAPTLPPGVLPVAEIPGAAGVHAHPGWTAEMPWLMHGMTGRAADMSLFAGAPVGAVLGRWTALRDALGAASMVHARQVHAGDVRVHEAVPPGLLIAGDADGHATAQPGVLLAVSVADCVPISLVAPAARAVALLHGGWRGVAAGILERGMAVLARHFRANASDVRIHLGPAICGACYEVGAEVPAGLGLPAHGDGGDGRTHVDLRAVLAHRALRLGVAPEAVTVSTFCTRCGDSPFYSHRAGCAERQIAVLGLAAA